MRSISLNKIRLFGYHGMYEEEKLLGNEFELNVEISYEPQSEEIDSNNYINYVNAYDSIKQIFSKPTELMETIAENICSALQKLDKRITTINISITKINPPISNFSGNVGVRLLKSYH